MKRGSATSGTDEHVQLVKLATKRIIDEFVNLRYISINYEKQNLTFQIKVRDGTWGETNSYFELRPDILLRAENKGKGGSIMDDAKKWENIMDSNAIIFEAETDPRNIFKNAIKLEAYKQIKRNNYGRAAYGFVLVVWEDAVLPENIEPFDEVWRFKKESKD